MKPEERRAKKPPKEDSVTSKNAMALCLRIRKERSLEAVKESGLKADMLSGTGRKLFDKLVSHYTNYGKMPAWKTVLAEVEVREETLPKALEPARYYADAIVKQHAIKSQREWMKKQAKALDEKDPDGVIEAARGLLHDAVENYGVGRGVLVNLRTNGPDRLAEYERLKTLDDSITGIRSPWDLLDEQTLGWNPGDLISVCARTSVGKTWWGILVADFARQQGVVVGFVSPEMSEKQVWKRRDSIRWRLPYEDFRKGQLDTDAEERYRAGVNAEGSAEGDKDFFIASDGRCETVEDIDLFIEEHKLGLLVVDGVHLLEDPKARNDYERISRASRRLKKIARRRKVPIVLIVQLGRSVKTGATTAGTEDIQGTDALAQDSDVLVMLFQDDDARSRGEMLQKAIKVREGRPITFTSAWDFSTMDFEVLPDDEAADKEDHFEEEEKKIAAEKKGGAPPAEGAQEEKASKPKKEKKAARRKTERAPEAEIPF